MSNSRNRRPTPSQRSTAQRTAPAARPVLAAAQGDDGTFAVPDEEIFDLDALRHEAADERFHFKVQGKIFDLLTPEEPNWHEYANAMSQSLLGEPRPLMAVLLGPQQYDEFRKFALQNGQIKGLLKQWEQWHGISEGESDASRSS